jgi:cystathionine beta-lyase
MSNSIDLTDLFDEPVARRGSDSGKWNTFGADVLPMWVADMDFVSPQPVIDALLTRVRQGVFGYGCDSRRLRTILVERMARLYDWAIEPQDIVFLPGLVCGLNVVSRAVGAPGDGVLVNTPVYGPFLTAPVNQEREVHVAELCATQVDGAVRYEFDVDATAAAIRPNTELFLVCNPHNPVGRVFTRRELEAMAALADEHDFVICSDEIHCDLLLDGNHHTPLASLAPEIAQRTVTLMAPSKTFNIPGLGASFAIVQNAELRKQVERAAAGIVPHLNILGMVAMEAAYDKGDEWLAALRNYLTANRNFVADYVSTHFPGIRATCPEATYLAWLDCRELGLAETPATFFLREAKVAMNDGAWFGAGGAGFVRLNFGTARRTLEQGLDQMRTALAKVGEAKVEEAQEVA